MNIFGGRAIIQPTKGRDGGWADGDTLAQNEPLCLSSLPQPGVKGGGRVVAQGKVVRSRPHVWRMHHHYQGQMRLKEGRNSQLRESSGLTLSW